MLELQKFVIDSPSNFEKNKNYDLDIFSSNFTNGNTHGANSYGAEVVAVSKNSVTGVSKEIGGVIGIMLKEGGGLLETIKGIYSKLRTKTNVKEKEVP
jgi:hypothetical protein